MRPTRIETIHLEEHATPVFVRRHRDEGLVGHGETKDAPAARTGFVAGRTGRDELAAMKPAAYLVNRLPSAPREEAQPG